MNPPLETRTPTRKVGRWTTAIGLIGIGVIFILQMSHIISFEVLKYVWPALLILLGIEVVLANLFHSDQKVRLGGLSVTILVLLLMVSAAQSVLPDWTTFINRGYLSPVQGTVSADGDIKRVQILLNSGKVNVTGTQDSNVIYEGKLRIRTASSQEGADSFAQEHWKAQKSGDTLTLTLDSKQSDFVLFDFTRPEDYLNVQIPESMEVEVHSKNSTIQAQQLDSNITATTSNGTIDVEDIQGNVSLKTSNGKVKVANIGGSSELVTDNGTVTLNQLAGSVYIRTSNGAITGDTPIGGDWDVKTSNGSINLTIPENSSANLTAKTSNSSIKGNIDWTDRSDSRANAILGDGSHKMGLTTSNGSISVNH